MTKKNYLGIFWEKRDTSQTSLAEIPHGTTQNAVGERQEARVGRAGP